MKKFFSASVLAASVGFSLSAQTYESLPDVLGLTHALTYVTEGDLNAEILAHDPIASTIYGTGGDGVTVLDVASTGALTLAREIDLSGIFGSADLFDGISSVAWTGVENVGVAVAIPAANTTTVGKVIFFAADTGMVIADYDGGFHPDSVIVDSGFVIVTNEGEFAAEGDPETVVNAPGGLTLIDISSATTAMGFAGLTANTFDFVNDLAEGVDLSGIRIIDTDNPEADLEPEYSTHQNGIIYTTIQNQNALSLFDIAAGQFIAVLDLGVAEHRVDASDRDDVIAVDDVVAGMFMPDTIASLVIDGATYLFTADEGDAREFNDSDVDIARLADVAETLMIDPVYEGVLNATYGDYTADENLGRIEASLISGDLDGDGDIDQFQVLGSRGFTIWASDGSIVFQSGPLIEDWLAQYDPEAWPSGREDNKGPEPEAIAAGMPFGIPTVFVGLERTPYVFMVDVTDPFAPVVMDAINLGDFGADRPESITYVNADNSPVGTPILLIGSEDSASIDIVLIHEGSFLRGLQKRFGPVGQAVGLDADWAYSFNLGNVAPNGVASPRFYQLPWGWMDFFLYRDGFAFVLSTDASLGWLAVTQDGSGWAWSYTAEGWLNLLRPFDANADVTPFGL